MKKKSKIKCEHDYIFLDKWQDANATYWEFACRWCLNLEIIGQTHKNFAKDFKGYAKQIQRGVK